MPIRKENRAKYPPDWAEISRRIRFERAAGQCECDGRCGEDHGGRCTAVHGEPHPMTSAKVVLTTMHLDHDPENSDDDDNLMAACQKCHNRYDGPMRRRGIAERRRKPWAVRDLFETAGGAA